MSKHSASRDLRIAGTCSQNEEVTDDRQPTEERLESQRRQVGVEGFVRMVGEVLGKMTRDVAGAEETIGQPGDAQLD